MLDVENDASRAKKCLLISVNDRGCITSGEVPHAVAVADADNAITTGVSTGSVFRDLCEFQKWLLVHQ